MEEKGIDVFLDDEGPIRVFLLLFVNVPSNLVYPLADFDPTPPIGIFPWLHNPQQLLLLFPLLLVLGDILKLLLRPFDVKSEWNIVEKIIIVRFAIPLEIIEEILLVSKQTMVLNVVVGNFDVLSLLVLQLPDQLLQVFVEVLPAALAFQQQTVFLAKDALHFFIEIHLLVVSALRLQFSTPRVLLNISQLQALLF